MSKLLNYIFLVLIFAGCVAGEVGPDKKEAAATTSLSVSSVLPTGGPQGGGTSITISGTDFQTGASVELRGAVNTNCTSVVVVSAVTITCTTPAVVTAGAYNVRVVNPDSTLAEVTNGYTYALPPSITTVLRTVGVGPFTSIAAAGGELMEIVGTDFQFMPLKPNPTVTIDGNAVTLISASATSLTFNSNTSLLNGAVNVTVTNSDGQSDATGTITYTPTIDLINVQGTLTKKGSTLGAETIEIEGFGFTGVDTVSFDPGGTPTACTGPVVTVDPTPTATSGQVITCTSGAHVAGLVDVQVTDSGTTQTDTETVNQFEYVVAPTITSVELDLIPLVSKGVTAGGYDIEITGTGFDNAGSKTTVTVDGNVCTSPTTLTTTTVRCTVPATVPAGTAGLVNVIVTNVDDALSVTSTNAFEYIIAPSSITVERNTIAGVSAGPLAGGDTINIVAGTGTFLQDSDNPIDVRIDPAGDNAVCTVTSPAAAANTTTATIQCTVPADTAGTYTVRVTTSDGQVYDIANAYEYLAAPTITSLITTSPAAIAGGTFGPITAGTTFSITGTGFYNDADSPIVITLDPGGAPAICTTSTFVSSTNVTCITDAHAAGTVDVRVANSDGQQVDLVAGFTHLPAPTITDVYLTASGTGFLDVPTSGGGITLIGTNFLAGATATIDGVACNVPTVVSPTTFTCTADVHAVGGPYSVVFTNGETTQVTSALQLTYRAPPTITRAEHDSFALVPDTPATGGTIKVLGTGFFGTTGNTTVTIDPAGLAVVCTPTVISTTSITCTHGAIAAGTYDIRVLNVDGQSVDGVGVITSRAAPTTVSISSPVLAQGPVAGGTNITITGTNFFNAAGNPTTVTIDPAGTPAVCSSVNVVNATTLTCSTGAHVASLPTTLVVRVTTSDGQTADSAGGLFVYRAAPTVTEVFVTASGTGFNDGPAGGGTAVTVTGTGFDDINAGVTVALGGTACAGVVVVNTTTITCTTGNHVVFAQVDAVVTNTDGQTGTWSNGWGYILAPTVATALRDAIAPNNVAYGSLAGGDSVEITGTNFYTGMVVTFDLAGTPAVCGSVVVTSSTTLTCTTGARIAGAVTVTVANSLAQSGISGGTIWTYQAAPTVTSITSPSPAIGPLLGTNTLTVAGTGFDFPSTAGFKVYVGANECTGASTASAISLTCTIPAGAAAGSYNVQVVNADMQSGTLALSYTYKDPPTVISVADDVGDSGYAKLVTITGTNFDAGSTVNLDTYPCTGVTVVSATTITCTVPTIPNFPTLAYNILVTDSASQTNAAGILYTYGDMADFEFTVGGASPTPPNPDPYGTPGVNTTHTFTITNNSTTTDTGPLTVTIIGANPGAFFKGTDTCTSTGALQGGNTCTIQLTFLSDSLPVGPTLYSATLQVTNGTITVTNDVNGTK